MFIYKKVVLNHKRDYIFTYFILVEPMRKFVLLLNVTIIMCAYISAVFPSCIDLTYRSTQYIYKILSVNTSIQIAQELADRDGGSLIVIEDQQTEREVVEFMRTCDIKVAWLGIQQVPPDRLLTDSGPWSWESDCDSHEDAIISFQGCYWEVNNDRDLPVDTSLSSGEVTGDQCITTCRDLNQNYAGIQNMFGEYRCSCGQSYGKHGEARGCSYRCPEGTSHSCGGLARNSVYYTKSNRLWGNWFPNYPINSGTIPFCVYIVKDPAPQLMNNFYLMNKNCDEKFLFLCTSHVNGSDCEDHEGFFYFRPSDDICYYLAFQKMEWHVAKHKCSEIRGKLLVIKNEEQHNLLATWLDLNYNIEEEIWVGASRNSFRRLDNNGTVCYTKYNGKLRRHTNAYVKRKNSGELLWKLSGDPNSTISLAAAVTQYRNTETTTINRELYTYNTEQTPDASSNTHHTTDASECVSGDCVISSTQLTTDHSQSEVTTHQTETSTAHTTQITVEATDNIDNVSEANQSVIGQEENPDIQSNISTGLLVIIILIVLLYYCLLSSVLLFYYKRKYVPGRSPEITLAKKEHRRNNVRNEQVNELKVEQIEIFSPSSETDSEVTDISTSKSDSSISDGLNFTDIIIEKYNIKKEWKKYLSTQSKINSENDETACSDSAVDEKLTLPLDTDVSTSSSDPSGSYVIF